MCSRYWSSDPPVGSIIDTGPDGGKSGRISSDGSDQPPSPLIPFDGASRGFSRVYLFVDGRALRVLRNPQIISGLEVEPKLGASAEITRQAKRSVGSDAASAAHNLVQACGGDVELPSKSIDTHAQGSKDVLYNRSSGMHLSQELVCHHRPS